MVLVVDDSTVVDGDVVAGDGVVGVGTAEVVVTTELDVLPPLIVLSVHDTSNEPTSAEPNRTRRTLMCEVCQR